MNINPSDIEYSVEDGFKNLKNLKKYKKPIYFIHAEMDHIIPLYEAERMLKESGSNDKNLFVVKGANHNNIIMILGNIYFENIKKFINNN